MYAKSKFKNIEQICDHLTEVDIPLLICLCIQNIFTKQGLNARFMPICMLTLYRCMTDGEKKKYRFYQLVFHKTLSFKQ